MSGFLRIFIVLLFAASSSFGQNEKQEDEATSELSVDEQISHHVRKQADEECRKRMEFMDFVIDDIVRLCELDEAQKSRLVLAAKGASKRSMERWHEAADRFFRQRLNGSDKETISEVLESFGSMDFGNRNSDSEGEIEAVWKDSLSDVLTKEQLTTYNNVLEARVQARIDAFAKMSIASLDSYLRLTPNQKDKITPIVHNSAKEYLDDIHRYWGEYVEKNMLMSLVNAADESTLRKIFSSTQYDRLQTATSSLEHFWGQRRRTAEKQKKEPGDQKAEAIKIGGNVNGEPRVIIKANGGEVWFKPQGPIFRGEIEELEAQPQPAVGGGEE